MVLYFSGTGNTKFAAEYIADRLNDDLISLNDVLKHKQPLSFHSERPFIIAAPIYAWGFPRIIVRLIHQAEFTGSREVYFIATMESQTGECGSELKALAREKRMNFRGFCGIPMPNNYISGGNLPSQSEAESKIVSSLELLSEISIRISEGWSIEKCDNTPFSHLLSGTVNKGFNKYMISSKGFRVTDECIGCGKCEKVCPVNNIVIFEGRPIFRDKCLNCYGCINRCPKQAINIGRRTAKRRRYVCPEYSEWKKKGLI